MPNDQEIKIEDVLQGLRLTPRFLNTISLQLTSEPLQNHFLKINETIANLDKPPAPSKPPRSEIYMRQWLEFRHGIIKSLERPALKYLCWESKVVSEPLFCKYLMSLNDTLPGRALKGLVCSLHSIWTDELPQTDIARFAARRIKSFDRRDRTLTKWKTGIEMLLGTHAPDMFAINVLLADLSEPKAAATAWAIEEQSEFMRSVTVHAAEKCLDRFGDDSQKTEYLLRTLLQWNGWDANPSGFKMIIGELILHKRTAAISEPLRGMILDHRLLGDPRLPGNRNKWLGVESIALQRFISWLSRRDIVFFFDSVLKGKDPHGRREFWLRYVDKMTSSRPFLSEMTARQFTNVSAATENDGQITLFGQEERGKGKSALNVRDVDFGKLSGGANQAAFILHFGEIVVVEFSNVGKIYIYTRNEFEKIIPDMWIKRHITENDLKNWRVPEERKIRHQPLNRIVNVDWREKATSILAREGIRP